MYKLEQFTGSEAREYAVEKVKKGNKQFKIMRIRSNVLSVFLLVALTYINPDNFIWFFLIYGLGTGVMGNWAISRIKKSYTKTAQKISEGKTQYVCVENFQCDTVLQFETVEGKIVERDFSEDAYGKYRKEQTVYIIYIPDANKWEVGKL